MVVEVSAPVLAPEPDLRQLGPPWFSGGPPSAASDRLPLAADVLLRIWHAARLARLPCALSCRSEAEQTDPVASPDRLERLGWPVLMGLVMLSPMGSQSVR